MSAEDKCLKLLKDTNKPYNVQGVADMLATQGVKKPSADRALAALAEQGKIMCKEFGKTKIYFPSQEGLAELAPEEKAAKMEGIKSLGAQLAALDEKITAMRKELAASNASMSVGQLQARFAELQEQAEALDKKLAIHRSGAGPQVSANDVTTAESTLGKLLDVWARRRRIFNDIWGDASENIDGKQADLFEDIGVDTDEAVGELLSNYKKLLTQSKKVRT